MRVQARPRQDQVALAVRAAAVESPATEPSPAEAAEHQRRLNHVSAAWLSWFERQGRAQNNASRAAINLRTAEGKAIQNRVASARAKVDIRQARIDAERLKATYQQEIRKLRSERLALLRARPKRVAPTLTAREFDTYTGEVQWPMAITNPILTKQRAAVEQALKPKTRMQKHADEKLAIAVDALRKAIGKNAQTLGYKKFASANNFAKRLQNQVKFHGKIKPVEMLASM